MIAMCGPITFFDFGKTVIFPIRPNNMVVRFKVLELFNRVSDFHSFISWSVLRPKAPRAAQAFCLGSGEKSLGVGYPVSVYGDMAPAEGLQVLV
jgi:hypothetical protein